MVVQGCKSVLYQQCQSRISIKFVVMHSPLCLSGKKMWVGCSGDRRSVIWVLENVCVCGGSCVKPKGKPCI